MTAGRRAGGRAGAALAALLLAGCFALGVGCAGGDDGAARPSGQPVLGAEAERGRQVACDKGCTSCHSSDRSAGVGPTWEGI